MNPPRLMMVVLAVAVVNAPLVAQPPTDNFGDPLPDGATARVGTARLRKPGGVTEWDGAVFTPDGKYLLSPARGGAIERIEVATGRVETVGEKAPGRDGREFLYLSADGTRGACASTGGTTAWDARTGRVLTKIERPIGHDRDFAALSADGSALAIGDVADRDAPGRKLAAVVWDVGAEKRRLDVEVVPNENVRVALSGDGKLLATWGDVRAAKPDPSNPPDSPVQFWDAVSGKSLWHFDVKRPEYVAVAFAPDGKSVAVSDGFGAIAFHDPRTGRELKRLADTTKGPVRLVISADGKTLAAGGQNAAVQLWDTATGKTIGTTPHPASFRGNGRGFAFTGERRLVAWGVAGSNAVVWDVPSGKELSTPGGLSEPPGSVAFTPDGKELLTNGRDWAVLRWDPLTGKSLGVRKLDAPSNRDNGAYGLRFPPPGRVYDPVQLLPGGATVDAWTGETRYIYDARTGKQLHHLGLTTRGDSPGLSADGQLTLTPVGVEEGNRPDPYKPLKVVVRDLAANKKLAEIELPAPQVHRATRTADATRLFTNVYLPAINDAQSGYVLTLWELATGKKLGEVKEPGTPAWFAPALGPDGKTVLATGAAGALRALDLTTGKEAWRIDTGDLVPCAGPVFSGDGKRFAVGLCDRANPSAGPFDVRVYAADSGRPLRTFRGHAGAVRALAFSPDGKALASASHDTTVLLWDMTTVPAPK